MASMSLWSKLRVAAKAFREAYVTADLIDSTDFEDFEARKLRYEIMWALYENTLFRNIHKWATAYRNQYSLYRHIRNIYNPAFRLTEFWTMMLWGGLLSDDAMEEGAIPIRTDQQSIRKAIAKLWEDSNWNVNKDVLTMWCCSMGDCGLRIVDDVEKKQTRLEVVHPATIKDLTLDPRGYVKAYEIEEARVLDGRTVLYNEVVSRGEGEDVIFETYADGREYGWNGSPAKWTEVYGFIPFIAFQHNNVGLDYGWAEIHPLRSKANEVDDLASKLHDYIRKAVDPVWLFNFKKPKKSEMSEFSGAEPTLDRPDPHREEIPALYSSLPNATAQPLVTDMIDIEKTAGEIQNILEEMERDYPELQMDIWTVGGYTTGRALRTARQRVERKVIRRRPGYDKALIRAHQMAIAIGGFREYNGYEGFNLDSYAEGKLKHTIPADRTIFAIDEAEEIDSKAKFWETIMAAIELGRVPLEMVLQDFGWSQDKIQRFLSSDEMSRGEMPEEGESDERRPDEIEEADTVQP